MNQYLVRPANAATFAPGTFTKTDLCRGSGLFLGLNCFEPGQRQAVHTHRGSDKFYLILSGKARMSVGGEEFEATNGDLIWAPADVPHGVAEALDRTVMLIGMAPPPAAKA